MGLTPLEHDAALQMVRVRELIKRGQFDDPVRRAQLLEVARERLGVTRNVDDAPEARGELAARLVEAGARRIYEDRFQPARMQGRV